MLGRKAGARSYSTNRASAASAAVSARSVRGPSVTGVKPAAAAAASVDSDAYPNLAQLGPYLRRDLAAAYFEFGLERLIADFTRLVKQHRLGR